MVAFIIELVTYSPRNMVGKFSISSWRLFKIFIQQRYLNRFCDWLETKNQNYSPGRNAYIAVIRHSIALGPTNSPTQLADPLGF